MAESPCLHRVRDELKRSVRLFIEQLRRDHPAERFYAVLLEIGQSGSDVMRIAGSEESLTRLAEQYIAKGYQVRSGDLLETLRATLRWDAPGDDVDGWYWGDEDADEPVRQSIEAAIGAGDLPAEDDLRDDDAPPADQPLRQLCLAALQELDHEGLFGTGAEREQIIIGMTCCEVDFGNEEDLPALAALNPASTIARLQRELQAGESAWDLLKRPR